MSHRPCLERVIVIPRNGYLNRLQAWASASILAAEYDVPVRVLWEHERIAPASPEDLFETGLVNASFIGRSEVDSLLGQNHEDLPRYLTCLPEASVAVLAGHDRGEQPFIGKLKFLIKNEHWLKTLIIIAGGRFSLLDDAQFDLKRREFYLRMAWSPVIQAQVSSEFARRSTFNALHIRETDHARTSPTQRQIRHALAELRREASTESLFIAADTPAARQRWSDESERLGFAPWTTSPISLDRESVSAGQAALVDWNLLAKSDAIIYSSVSSFAEEASVAAGCVERSFPLTSNKLRTWARDSVKLLDGGRNRLLR